MRGPAVLVGLLALFVLSVLWAPGACQHFYHREATAVRRLAEEIDGVVVLEVDGIHDTTLEDIWLDIEYRGERIYFSSVTVVTATGAERRRRLRLFALREPCDW